jgi:hypothetical protein
MESTLRLLSPRDTQPLDYAAIWPGLIYVRARPTWIRYSDYNVDPPQIVEFTARISCERPN